MYRQLLKLDNFASPVATINLKGEEKIRTIPGALASIVTYAFLIYIATKSFTEMVDYQNNKIQSYSVDLSRS